MVSSVNDLPREVRHQIPEWKKQYRYIYAATFDTGLGDVPAVFRVLTREEMRYIEETQPYYDEWWSEGWIIGHCLLAPGAHSLDDWDAGAVAALGMAIMEASGWSSPQAIEETLGMARQNTHTLDSAMVSFILKAFPSMKADDLGKLTFIDLIGYLAQAEVILGQNLETDMWLNPRKFERRLRRQRKQLNRPVVPGEIPMGADAFQTPAEAMFSEAELRQKPSLKFMPSEPASEEAILNRDSATRLSSNDAIMDEMMAQRDFLGVG